jgi:hypothetical protein
MVDVIEPLQRAQTLQILVSAGIKTQDEARAERGLPAMGSDATVRARLVQSAP